MHPSEDYHAYRVEGATLPCSDDLAGVQLRGEEPSPKCVVASQCGSCKYQLPSGHRSIEIGELGIVNIPPRGEKPSKSERYDCVVLLPYSASTTFLIIVTTQCRELYYDCVLVRSI